MNERPYSTHPPLAEIGLGCTCSVATAFSNQSDSVIRVDCRIASSACSAVQVLSHAGLIWSRFWGTGRKNLGQGLVQVCDDCVQPVRPDTRAQHQSLMRLVVWSPAEGHGLTGSYRFTLAEKLRLCQRSAALHVQRPCLRTWFSESSV